VIPPTWRAGQRAEVLTTPGRIRCDRTGPITFVTASIASIGRIRTPLSSSAFRVHVRRQRPAPQGRESRALGTHESASAGSAGSPAYGLTGRRPRTRTSCKVASIAAGRPVPVLGEMVAGSFVWARTGLDVGSRTRGDG
jgi:hypothetical protein